MSELTLFIAAGTELASDTRGCLDSWHQLGILRSYGWITAEHLTDPPIAAVHQPGVEPPRTLGDILAGDAWTVIRVVGVALESSGGEGAAETERLAAFVAGRRGRRQRVETLQVIAPRTDAAGLSRDMLVHAVGANALVAPEDRIADHHFDGGVSRETHAEHAAHALAVLGALWVGAPVAPLDGVNAATVQNEPGVLMVRCFSRHAYAAALADQVAMAMIGDAGNAARFAMEDDWTLSTDHPSDVRAVASSVIVKHATAISHRAVNPVRPPGIQAIHPREAFRMMLSYLFAGVRALPRRLRTQVSDTVRRKIEDVAQTATFGEGSLYQVSMTGHLSSGADATEPDDPEVLAARVLDAVGTSESPPTPSALWRDLRDVSFGLLDGGPIPAGLHEPRDGTRRRIIDQAGAVAIDPRSEPFSLERTRLRGRVSFPSSAFDPIAPMDALRGRELELLIESELRRIGEPTEVSPGEDDEESRTELAESALTEDEREELIALLNAALLRLRAWIDQRAATLTWQVAERIAEGYRSAAASLLRSLALVRRGPGGASGGGEAAEKEWSRYRWIMGIALLLVVVAGGVAGLAAGAVLAALTLAPFGLIVGLVGLTRNFILYQQAMFKLLHARETALAEYETALLSVTNDALELRRLALVYAHHQDWSTIIGLVLHRRVAPEQTPDRGDSGSGVAQPRALRIGEAVTEERLQVRLARKLARAVLGRGWLMELYEQTRRESAAEWKFEAGLDLDAADPSPETETTEPSFRRALANYIGGERFGQAWTASVCRRVAALITKLPFSEVLTNIALADGAAEEPEAFFSAILSSGVGQHLGPETWGVDARLYGDDVVDVSRRWGPSGLSDTDAEVETIERSFEAEDLMVFSSVRVDVTRPIRPGAFGGLFAPAEYAVGAEPKAAPWSDEDVL